MLSYSYKRLVMDHKPEGVHYVSDISRSMSNWMTNRDMPHRNIYVLHRMMQMRPYSTKTNKQCFA